MAQAMSMPDEAIGMLERDLDLSKASNNHINAIYKHLIMLRKKCSPDEMARLMHRAKEMQN